jgi:RecJ-like exonuclease
MTKLCGRRNLKRMSFFELRNCPHVAEGAAIKIYAMVETCGGRGRVQSVQFCEACGTALMAHVASVAPERAEPERIKCEGN